METGAGLSSTALILPLRHGLLSHQILASYLNESCFIWYSHYIF